MNNDTVEADKNIPECSSDWQVITYKLEACFARGDLEEADDLFAELQHKTTAWLLAIAKDMLPEEDAQDVVVDVYVGLYDRLSKRQSIRHIKGFLRTLVKRRAIDILRKHKESLGGRVDVADDSSGSDQEEVANPIPESDFKMVFRTLRNALIEKMPSPEKEILFLRHYHGLSVDETAQRLRLTPDKVKKRTQKAIEIASQIAAERGIEL
jgi:RNA polymerase sigma factor (sigma-70 family)